MLQQMVRFPLPMQSVWDFQTVQLNVPMMKLVDVHPLKGCAERRVGSNPTRNTKWSNDETGRRASLKMMCRKACGFDSHLDHKNMPS